MEAQRLQRLRACVRASGGGERSVSVKSGLDLLAGWSLQSCVGVVVLEPGMLEPPGVATTASAGTCQLRLGGLACRLEETEELEQGLDLETKRFLVCKWIGTQ